MLFATGHSDNGDVSDTELMTVFNNGTLAKCITPNLQAPLPLQDATGGMMLTLSSKGDLVHMPVVCGGWLARTDYKKHCYRLGQSSPIGTLTRERVGAVSVVINNGNRLWVTGGRTIYDIDQDTTDILDISPDKESSDPHLVLTDSSIRLPRKISYHCLEMLDSTTAFLFGGSEKYYKASVLNRSWTLDLGNYESVEWEQRASMLEPRWKHSCGVLRVDEEGQRKLVVAAGGEVDYVGQITDTVDVLHIKGKSLSKSWQFGPSMKVALSSAVSVTTSDQLKLIVAGGITVREELSAMVFQFQCRDIDLCHWKQMDVSLYYPRDSMVGMVFPGLKKDQMPNSPGKLHEFPLFG